MAVGKHHLGLQEFEAAKSGGWENTKICMWQNTSWGKLFCVNKLQFGFGFGFKRQLLNDTNA